MITALCTRSRSNGDQAEGSGSNWGMRCTGGSAGLGGRIYGGKSLMVLPACGSLLSLLSAALADYIQRTYRSASYFSD